MSGGFIATLRLGATLSAGLLVCLAPAAAADAEYGRLSGRVWMVGRDYRTVGGPGGAVGLRPLDGYLSVTWADVGVRGFDMDLMLRGVADLRQEGAADDQVDLMSLRVLWRGARPGLDLTLGRQFLVWGNGYYNFDGLRVDWRWRRGWGALAFAGLPLGFQEHASLRSEGRTYGAGVSYERPLIERYVIMAERQTLDGDLSRQRLSVDLRRTFGLRVTGYGSADYNDALDRFGDVLAGVQARLGRHLRAGAEWMRYLPEFPLESIFNTFDVQPFTESRVEAGWEGSARSGAWVRVGRQRFERTDVRERERYFTELTLRPPRRRGPWIEATLFQVSGYGGDRRGARVSAGGPLPWRGLSIRGGADLHDFRNPFRLVERDEAVSAWGRVDWQAPRGWSAWVEGRQQWSVLGRREFEAAAGAGLRFGSAP